MGLPNFLIIGAAKSGTTTLYECLKTHPQIYMSPLREGAKFFSYDPELYRRNNKEKGIHGFPITNMEDYRTLFKDATNEIAIGESSPHYLYSSIAPQRIRESIPDVKLITILRDPASRAYSQYVMWCRYNRLKKRVKLQNLTENFITDIKKGNGGTCIRYYDSLTRYLNIFDREQLRIYLFDDLKVDQNAVLNDICRYLNVDDDFFTHVNSKKYNRGGMPKNAFLFDCLEQSKQIFRKTMGPVLPESSIHHLDCMYAKLRNLNLTEAPPLSRDIRKQLVDIYRQDIYQLQDLLQRDLSKWLEY